MLTPLALVKGRERRSSRLIQPVVKDELREVKYTSQTEREEVKRVRRVMSSKESRC